MKPSNRKPSILWVLFSLAMIAALLAACAGPAATEAPVQPAETEVMTEEPVMTEEATEPPAPEETEPAAPAETEAAPTEAVAEGEDFSPDIPDPEEPVTVSFAFWGDPETPYWQSVTEEFQAAHPNITIEYQVVPSEEIFDKLLTQIAAGNPPDAAYVSDWMTGAFALNEGLVPLDDYISKSTIIDLNDYVPAFLQPARVNDVQYGLPFASETTGLFYRTDRFEEAGLDPNHPPQTWEEFQEYAELLTNPAENKYGFAVFAPEAAYYFYPWLWQAGGEQLNPEDPNDIIWDSPEGQKAADFYANLANYSPQDLLNATSWDGRVPFASGDVAMYMAGAWFAGVLLTEFPDATGLWAAAPLPTDQRCATTIAGDHLVIFKDSPNPEAAYKWIEFLSAPENMVEYNLGTPDYPGTLLPPRQSLLDDPVLYESRPYMEGFKDNMDCAFVPEADQPRYFEIEEILTEQLGRAFYGEVDGATAVSEAAVEGEALLAEE
jgi:ABC-type glycerol-3-phosphate transport system substrate-binding protein